MTCSRPVAVPGADSRVLEYPAGSSCRSTDGSLAQNYVDALVRCQGQRCHRPLGAHRARRVPPARRAPRQSLARARGAGPAGPARSEPNGVDKRTASSKKGKTTTTCTVTYTYEGPTRGTSTGARVEGIASIRGRDRLGTNSSPPGASSSTSSRGATGSGTVLLLRPTRAAHDDREHLARDQLSYSSSSAREPRGQLVDHVAAQLDGGA